jgi:hypothetical protein
MKTYKIAAINGDGIGHEIVPMGIKVMQAAALKYGFELDVTDFPQKSTLYNPACGQLGRRLWRLSFLAAKKLEREQSLDVAVISMHTIKPLDYKLLARLAKSNKPIITIEEHSIYGGLGEACASFLLQNRSCNPFKIIAIPDEYTITGSQMQIFDHYGISEKGISDVALNS